MRKHWYILITLCLLFSTLPVSAQGGAGTKDFYIRDFGACINLPDFTIVSNPDEFNTLYDVPSLFSIKFAEYLIPLSNLPASSDAIYNAMITLLDTVNANNYQRIEFNHPEYTSAAVEFTLDGKRMFGMIYRNQDERLFFLFADKVEDFDMLAIGRAIFAADRQCTPLNLAPPVGLVPGTNWNVENGDTCISTIGATEVSFVSNMPHESSSCRVYTDPYILGTQANPVFIEANIRGENYQGVDRQHAKGSLQILPPYELNLDFTAECAIYYGGNYSWINFNIQGPPDGDNLTVFDIKPDQAHHLRLEIDPVTTQIRCFVDRRLIGTYTPSNAEELKSLPFFNQVTGYNPDSQQATFYVNTVRTSQ